MRLTPEAIPSVFSWTKTSTTQSDSNKRAMERKGKSGTSTPHIEFNDSSKCSNLEVNEARCTTVTSESESHNMNIPQEQDIVLLDDEEEEEKDVILTCHSDTSSVKDNEPMSSKQEGQDEEAMIIEDSDDESIVVMDTKEKKPTEEQILMEDAQKPKQYIVSTNPRPDTQSQSIKPASEPIANMNPKQYVVSTNTSTSVSTHPSSVKPASKPIQNTSRPKPAILRRKSAPSDVTTVEEDNEGIELERDSVKWYYASTNSTKKAIKKRSPIYPTEIRHMIDNSKQQRHQYTLQRRPTPTAPTNNMHQSIYQKPRTGQNPATDKYVLIKIPGKEYLVPKERLPVYDPKNLTPEMIEKIIGNISGVQRVNIDNLASNPKPSMPIVSPLTANTHYGRTVDIPMVMPPINRKVIMAKTQMTTIGIPRNIPQPKPQLSKRKACTPGEPTSLLINLDSSSSDDPPSKKILLTVPERIATNFLRMQQPSDQTRSAVVSNCGSLMTVATATTTVQTAAVNTVATRVAPTVANTGAIPFATPVANKVVTTVATTVANTVVIPFATPVATTVVTTVAQYVTPVTSPGSTVSTTNSKSSLHLAKSKAQPMVKAVMVDPLGTVVSYSKSSTSPAISSSDPRVHVTPKDTVRDVFLKVRSKSNSSESSKPAPGIEAVLVSSSPVVPVKNLRSLLDAAKIHPKKNSKSIGRRAASKPPPGIEPVLVDVSRQPMIFDAEAVCAVPKASDSSSIQSSENSPTLLATSSVSSSNSVRASQESKAVSADELQRETGKTTTQNPEELRPEASLQHTLFPKNARKYNRDGKNKDPQYPVRVLTSTGSIEPTTKQMLIPPDLVRNKSTTDEDINKYLQKAKRTAEIEQHIKRVGIGFANKHTSDSNKDNSTLPANVSDEAHNSATSETRSDDAVMDKTSDEYRANEPRSVVHSVTQYDPKTHKSYENFLNTMLKTEIPLKAPSRIKCAICKMSFPAMAGLFNFQNHFSSFFCVERIQCHICEEGFCRDTDFFMHLHVVHDYKLCSCFEWGGNAMYRLLNHHSTVCKQTREFLSNLPQLRNGKVLRPVGWDEIASKSTMIDVVKKSFGSFVEWTIKVECKPPNEIRAMVEEGNRGVTSTNKSGKQCQLGSKTSSNRSSSISPKNSTSNVSEKLGRNCASLVKLNGVQLGTGSIVSHNAMSMSISPRNASSDVSENTGRNCASPVKSTNIPSSSDIDVVEPEIDHENVEWETWPANKTLDNVPPVASIPMGPVVHIVPTYDTSDREDCKDEIIPVQLIPAESSGTNSPKNEEEDVKPPDQVPSNQNENSKNDIEIKDEDSDTPDEGPTHWEVSTQAQANSSPSQIGNHDRTSSTSDNINVIAAASEEVGGHECQDCGERFKYQLHLAHHVGTVHQEGPCTCYICQRRGVQARLLQSGVDPKS